MRSLLPIVGTFLLLSLPFRSVSAAAPTLSAMTPGALAPGKTTEVTLSGANLQTVQRLWVSSGEIKLTKAEAKSLVCAVTLPASAAGVGGILAANPDGVSGVLLAPVDALASVAEAGSHGTVETAQAVSLPVAIDGAFNTAGADFFRVELTAGQRLAIDCWSARLGIAFDPVVRVLDASGRELACADDDEALGADLMLEYTAQQAGPVIVEIRDNRYRGGGRYRLRLGDFPVATAAFPPAIQAGKKQVAVAPATATEAAAAAFSQPIDAPPFAPGVVAHYGFQTVAGGPACAAPVLLSSLPQFAEANADVTEVSLPCGINGRLQTPGEVDRYRFTGVKGSALRLQTRTHSLGSPSLLKLRLLKPDGSTLAASPPATTESTLAATLPADGEYQLEVEDLLQRGGPRHVYHVSAEVNSFALELKHEKTTKAAWNFPAGDGAAALTVTVSRHGEKGPIQLQATDRRVRLYPTEIPSGAKSISLVVATPKESQPGDLAAWRIIAAAGSQQKVVATRATVVAGSPSLIDPPSWLDGLLRSGVVKAAGPLFAAAAQPPESKNEKGQLAYKIPLERKQKDFKDPVRMIPIALPAGVTLAAKLEKDVFQVTVGGADKLEAGATLKVALFGQFKERGQVLELELPTEPPKTAPPKTEPAKTEPPKTEPAKPKAAPTK